MKRDLYKVLAESYEQVVANEGLNDMDMPTAQPAAHQPEQVDEASFSLGKTGLVSLAHNTPVEVQGYPESVWYLPAGTPQWIFELCRNATAEQLEAIANHQQGVQGFGGSRGPVKGTAEEWLKPHKDPYKEEMAKPTSKPTPAPVPPQPTHKVPFKKNPLINKFKDKTGSFGDLGKRLG